MRRLKNWTITAEPVKKQREGFLLYYAYLKSKSGKHKYQEINELTGKQSAFNIIRRSDAFNLARKLDKGGRPSNYAWSVVFSYPFELDDKTMSIIFKKNMQKFYTLVSDENGLGLTDKDIEKLIKHETVAISHRGLKSNGNPINNHLHALIPKHFRSTHSINVAQSIVSINLTQKKYLKALKLFNNETVNEVIGMELFDYQIKSIEERKKRQSMTKYTQQQEYENKTADKVDEAVILLDEVMAHIERYKLWANANETHDESIPRELQRALRQLKNGNTRRAAKTLTKYKSPTQ